MSQTEDWPPVDATLEQMLEAMAHLKDEVVFRYFQPSTINSRGGPCAIKGEHDTLRLTMGQIRRDVARLKGS